jgi:tetratricopeptide (TPR) repeat protein
MAFGLLLLALLLAASPAQADGPRQLRRVDSLLAASERELAQGRRERAVRKLAQALARDADARLLLRYGELALPFGAAVGAHALVALEPPAALLVEAFTRVDPVAAEPETLRRSRLYAAFAMMLVGQADDAIALVLVAGRLQDGATVHCLRAIAAVAAQRDELALAERALSFARQYMLQDVAVMGDLGRVLLARGRPDEAAALLGERFAIEPLSLTARRDLAYALLAGGRAADALALLAAAQDTCLRSAGCALEAARAALEADRPETALVYARARLRERGDDLDALFLVADAHVRSGELEAARAAYAQVLRAHPESARAKQAIEQLSGSLTETR